MTWGRSDIAAFDKVGMEHLPGASDQVKPNAWEWNCNMCTFINRPQMSSCDMCGFPRGTSGKTNEKVTQPGHCRELAVASQSGHDGTGARVMQPDAGRQILAALKHKDEVVPQGPRVSKTAGSEILAALKCSSSNAGDDASRQILAALKHPGGSPGSSRSCGSPGSASTGYGSGYGSADRSRCGSSEDDELGEPSEDPSRFLLAALKYGSSDDYSPDTSASWDAQSAISTSPGGYGAGHGLRKVSPEATSIEKRRPRVRADKGGRVRQ